MPKSAVPLLLLLACTACDPTSDDDALDALVPQLDGGADGATLDAFTPTGDAAFDAYTAPGDAGDAAVAQDAFRITLSASECLGDCPVYALTVDSSGPLRYVGKSCTARPGTFDQQLPPTAIAAIGEALAASGYATLRDEYVDSDDGCTAVTTDGPSYLLTIQANGSDKSIRRYSGCNGAPDVARVDLLKQALVQHAGAEPWLEGPFNCGARTYNEPSFEGGYTLSRAGTSLGLLALHAPHGDLTIAGWALSTCEEAITSGRSIVEPTRRLLVGSSEEPLMLPVLGKVGSIVLSKPIGGTVVTAKAYTNEGEVELTIEPGSCPSNQ